MTEYSETFLKLFIFILFVVTDYQNTITMSSSEHEDILKVSRRIPSRDSCYDESYHSKSGRDSHVWNSYSHDGVLESPSSSAGSLDPASPRYRSHGDNNGSGNFYVTMSSGNSKVSVSLARSLIYIHLDYHLTCNACHGQWVTVLLCHLCSFVDFNIFFFILISR